MSGDFARFSIGLAGLSAALWVSVAAPASAQNIVIVGPSSVAGAGVARSEAFPAQLEALLRAKGVNATVVNAGISGEQTPQMLARLNGVVPAGTNLAILHFTVFNDDPRSRAGNANPIPRAQTERNFVEMVKLLRARGVPTVVMARAGGGRGATYVPYPQLKWGTTLLRDGIHPSPQGHAEIAARLLPTVERALRARR